MSMPIFDVTIDPSYSENGQELGIEMIAFTDKPAILIKGMAYTSEQRKIFFSDDLKYRIVAPVMIPGDIYRRDDDGFEYQTRFTADTIEQIHMKFMENLRNRDLFNVDHNENVKVPAYILESWIVENPKEDKAYSSYGIEVPKGTLMAVAQITDKEYYTKLVEGGKVGFSIEGFLGLKQEVFTNQKTKYMNEGDVFQIGEQYFKVVNGIPVPCDKDGNVMEQAMAEESPEKDKEEDSTTEEAPEKDKEEEMAEETQAPSSEEAPADNPVTEESVMAIVQPHLDELLSIIAELKSAIPVQEEMEKQEEVQMTAHQKFQKFNQK